MDYAQLRTLPEPLITGLKDAGTHTMLPTLAIWVTRSLGLRSA